MIKGTEGEIKAFVTEILTTWYDNEIGYVHRLMELTRRVALTLPRSPGSP
jgi:glyceraldehyde-3-phosphate dehydrogenase/erythrose-4-phosphate dehydrogenase